MAERRYGGILQEERWNSLSLFGPEPPRVFAVDPGGTTGWACVWWDPEVMWDPTQPLTRAPLAWEAGMIGGNENDMTHLVLQRLFEYGSEGNAAVVIESFVLGRMSTDPALLSPVRITAKMDYVLERGMTCADDYKRSWTYTPQAPSDALTVITDGRLKLWNMYSPGPDHARAATKHALLHLRKLRALGRECYNRMYIKRERGY